MTLTFVMMSVVAFAQQTEQKALPSLKKQPTLKQQILQAKREGKQLNKETIAQFKYNKPAASQIIKKQQRNLRQRLLSCRFLARQRLPAELESSLMSIISFRPLMVGRILMLMATAIHGRLIVLVVLTVRQVLWLLPATKVVQVL